MTTRFHDTVEFWDGEKWIRPGAAGAIISNTEPTNPGNGTLWLNPDSGELQIYVDDGTNPPAWLVVGGDGGGGDGAGKMDLVPTATKGNLAVFDADGQVEDGGAPLGAAALNALNNRVSAIEALPLWALPLWAQHYNDLLDLLPASAKPAQINLSYAATVGSHFDMSDYPPNGTTWDDGWTIFDRD